MPAIERAFGLVVGVARPLRHLPLLPHLADAGFRLAVAVADRPRHRAVQLLEETVASWPGVRTGWHRFGGVDFLLDGRELGHVHGCGLLDVRLGRAAAALWIARGVAEPHHIFGTSGWVSRWVRTGSDLPDALRLLKAAADAADTD